MYKEGDLIKLKNLDETVSKPLTQSLDIGFESIQFYFVSYDEDDYVTLSAEANQKVAIIHCPFIQICGSQLAEEINNFCTHLLINGTLDRWIASGDERNKNAFYNLTRALTNKSI